MNPEDYTQNFSPGLVLVFSRPYHLEQRPPSPCKDMESVTIPPLLTFAASPLSP